MNNEMKQGASGKKYEAPQLVVVSLRPEEAVLGHCKISGGSGPSQTAGPCDIFLAGCRSIGS
jgi:hypothetical protein